MADSVPKLFSPAQIAVGGLLGTPIAALVLAAANAPVPAGGKCLLAAIGAAGFLALNWLAPTDNAALATLVYVVIVASILAADYLNVRRYTARVARSWSAVALACVLGQAVVWGSYMACTRAI